MAECCKGGMPECRYFTTDGCVSPFNCMYKIERGSITTATSTPLNPDVTYTTDTDKDNKIARLQAENSALRERLDKAIELPCRFGDKVWLLGDENIFEGAIGSVVINTKTDVEICDKAMEFQICFVTIDDYNKTWFTDRAEVEKRFAELKGGK